VAPDLRCCEVTRLLHRQGALVFGAVSLLVVWAFWSSYFSRPFDQPDIFVHAHALSQTLWCLLLTLQAGAIRTRHTWIHERVGAASPVLVAVILLTTLALMRHRMEGLPIMDVHLKVMAFNLSTLIAFALLYGLAMFHRRDARLHAAYMACTVFPFFTAFAPRLIQSSRPLMDVSMSLFGNFVALGQAGLIPGDVIAFAMSVRDWRTNRRLSVFPVALALLLTIHVSTVTLYRLPAWRSTVELFVSSL